MKNLLLILVLNCYAFSFSQINKAEYFIDSDPGVGLGIDIPLTSGFTVSENFLVNTSALSVGIHTLYVRIQNTSGEWSLYDKHNFLVHDYSTTSSPSEIVAAEYFIDTDPSVGNGVPISITSGFSVSETLAINTGTLSNGIHKLHVRVKDLDNTWSLYWAYNFLVHDFNQSMTSPIDMVEYYFDTDPGIGNGTSISISPNSFNVNESIVIPTTGLNMGTHYLYMRARDTSGNWSLYERVEFEVGTLSTEDHFILLVNIYPIPAEDYIDIKAQNQILKNIELYNLDGKLIFSHKNTLHTSNYRMDLSSVSKGIYLLKTQTDKGIQSRKIIIK